MKISLIPALFLITFSAMAQQPIVLQPDELHSCDASLGYHEPYGTQDMNYANDTYFKAFCFDVNGSINLNRGVIAFDLSQLLNMRSSVQSARLSLYAAGYINPTFTGHMGSNEATLRRITSTWSESSVTWNTAPSVTSNHMVYLPQSNSSNEDYLDIDVTGMVNDMLADGNWTGGFLLSLTDESPGNALAFYSSNTDFPEKRPRLVIQTQPLSVNTINTELVRIFQGSGNGDFTIDVSEQAEIRVYNETGQLVFSESNVRGRRDIDLDLPKGIYYLAAGFRNSVITKRVLIL